MSTITLPISTFLDCLWSYRDRAYVSKELAEIIRIADTDGLSEVHEEKPSKDDRTIGTAPVYVVWRRKEWLIHYDCIQKQRADAQLRFIEHEKYKLLHRKVSVFFQQEMGLADATIADSTASKLLESRGKDELIEKIRLILGKTITINDDEI